MSDNLTEMPLATVLGTAERLFAGVMEAVSIPADQRFVPREKGAAPPGQFAICIQIPLCVSFLKELQRRGVPIPDQEWLVEEFDAVMSERKS